MKIQTLTIVGVGLIGGSIGLAAKRRGIAERVIGTGRHASSLYRANELGAIDHANVNLAEAVHLADLAVFCTPVDLIVGQVLSTAPGCSRGTVLTDVGSTKAVITEGIEKEMPEGVSFAGSHPLAGSEKRGVEHARADLFRDRLTIVTQSAQTDPSAVARVADFWKALGSRVKIMDPVEHDKVLALTSHLPHLAAAALCRTLKFEEFTASGFRDTTRIAAGDPAIWTAIFLQNRAWVLEALAQFSDRLGEFKRALVEEDRAAIGNLLSKAKEVRDALGS